MAMPEHAQHPPKTLGESALCFACMAGIVLAAAVGLQWLMHLLP